ncbi:DUF6361 family protein [Kordiimonas pumila]|uniref:DUF6361 family protein n=1 Tax=Kordiimonas pumila TaxID=2161677 RepID=A0ABV7D9A7_9PROT|nr:DUF6361 family protein [Kordiimonas pumila]
MPSQLAWIDHDSTARERTLRILSRFQEKESRDELGLGSIRDSFADQLFPGTSTIQTRLRYMLFVPWIYRTLEDERVPAENFAAQADFRERELVEALMESDDLAGVFGKTAGKSLKRLPSSVYWAGLGKWKIRRTQFSQDVYHRRIDEDYRHWGTLESLEQDARVRGDDFGQEQRDITKNWHPQLPKPPVKFPAKIGFNLTREEAEFIQECIQAACPGSLLSFLVLHCKPADTLAPWEHPDYASFSTQHQELLTHARLFSEVMHGASLLYNIQLAKLKNHEALVDEHQTSFNNWIESFSLDELRKWSIERLWELTSNDGHNVTGETKFFIEAWIKHTRKSPEDLLANTDALNLIKRREMKLKGVRSRFRNQQALEQWGGYSGVGTLVYRWPTVQVLLNDLYNGLSQ